MFGKSNNPNQGSKVGVGAASLQLRERCPSTTQESRIATAVAFGMKKSLFLGFIKKMDKKMELRDDVHKPCLDMPREEHRSTHDSGHF